jgi:hypothetical protein
MLRSLAASAVLALAVLVPAAAQAKTVRAKVVQSDIGGRIACYATLPAEGRGIVCASTGLKAGPKTNGLDPFLSLSPHGRATFGGRGDYGGYTVKRPAKMIPGDRWRWHGITCTLGHDALSCRNRDGHGFVLGAAGWSRI